jgi:hypothetical protein
LFGRWLQPDCAACRRSHTVMNDFDARRLLIKKETVVLIAENQDIDSARFQISEIIQPEFLRQHKTRRESQEQEQKHSCSLLPKAAGDASRKKWLESILTGSYPHETLLIAGWSVLLRLRLEGIYSLISETYLAPQR